MWSLFRGLPGPNVTKFLSSMNCFGSESSIFMCRNPGWKQNIPSDCYEPNRNAGVFCYNNGRYPTYLYSASACIKKYNMVDTTR